MVLALPQNQLHRADISKLIVHRSARKQDGVALPIAAAESRHIQGTTRTPLATSGSGRGWRAGRTACIFGGFVARYKPRGITKPHLCSLPKEKQMKRFALVLLCLIPFMAAAQGALDGRRFDTQAGIVTPGSSVMASKAVSLVITGASLVPVTVTTTFWTTLPPWPSSIVTA